MAGVDGAGGVGEEAAAAEGHRRSSRRVRWICMRNRQCWTKEVVAEGVMVEVVEVAGRRI
jgi:hypothetical protein